MHLLKNTIIILKSRNNNHNIVLGKIMSAKKYYVDDSAEMNWMYIHKLA